MIAGRVGGNRITITLALAEPLTPREIEAVVDTGYNGYVTLPGSIVTACQLRFAGHRRGTVADGSVVLLDVYMARVVWHGQEREVLASEVEGEPLVGMSLLYGSRLTVEVIEGGSVAIEELP